MNLQKSRSSYPIARGPPTPHTPPLLTTLPAGRVVKPIPVPCKTELASLQTILSGLSIRIWEKYLSQPKKNVVKNLRREAPGEICAQNERKS